jgi:transposase
MSAIPLTTSTDTKAPPGPKGVAFVPIREASFRSGWPIETIKSRCQREWEPKGLARIEASDSGKPSWHVREDADAAFARIKSPAAMRFDARDYTDAQRTSAERRKTMLDDWMEWRADWFQAGKSEREITEMFVARCRADGNRVSRSRLFDWYRSYSSTGLRGLVDGRAKGREITPAREWFEAELERLFLSSRRRSMKLCYDRAVDRAIDEGRQIPYRIDQARRFMRSIPSKVACLHREGPRAFDARFGRYVRRSRDLASNDVWTSDGHKFDVQVMYRGKPTRPILISWMDAASRYVVGYSIEPRAETADAIRLALKRAIEAHGTPVSVLVDNGRAYCSQHLQGQSKASRRAGERASIDLGIFPRLGVAVRHSTPYNPKSKGEVERWHRTICTRFACELPGYTTGNPLDKPHTFADEVKAGKLLDFDDFCERFRAWLIADYHHREHSGEGMEGKTPAQAFADRMVAKRPLSEAQVELELCRRVRVTVGRNGVSVKLHGKTLAYEHALLDLRTGETVDVVIDDDRLDQAGVYALDGSRLCVAMLMADVSVNATPAELRDAMTSIRRDRRAAREWHETKMRIADDPFDRMRRRAAELERTSPVPVPQTLKPARMGDVPAKPMRIAKPDDFDYADYADEAVNQ